MIEATNINGKIDLEEPHTVMTDVELEQLIISIVQTENDILAKRIFGYLKKELGALKDELLKELKK